MPLADQYPVLDDRSFPELVDEVKARIPRYAPEWTDFNDNDPGMALVQVFAFLTEMLLFRLNQVPKLNYLKFLDLLGIELESATAAVADITFPVEPKHGEAYVVVPSLTRVAANVDDGSLAMFETRRQLNALRAQLAEVWTVTSGGLFFESQTEKNDEETVRGSQAGFYAFGQNPRTDNALVLGFDDEAFPGAEFPADIDIDLSFWFREDRAQPVARRVIPPAKRASALVEWEYWTGSRWNALTLQQDQTEDLTQSGHVLLRAPARRSMKRTVLPNPQPSAPATPGGRPANPAPKLRFWIRARLTRDRSERPPTLLAVRSNTIEADQAETVRDEVLGGSNGRADQAFQVQFTPVLKEGVTVEVIDESGTAETWTETDDLRSAGKSGTVYALNRTTGEIRFGNGTEGQVPSVNFRNPGANIVARFYRYGGGQRGNVKAGAISLVQGALDGIKTGDVKNLFDAFGGGDEESIDSAIERVPARLRQHDRAVTAEDYEEIARRSPSIARAKALPLHHPDFPDVEVPGVVTVIVVPDSNEPNPRPSEDTVRRVRADLNLHRTLTTELFVVGPQYSRVGVEIELVVERGADQMDLRNKVKEAVETYLHPLTGGERKTGWPFGAKVSYSKVMRQILEVRGVEQIEDLRMTHRGGPVPPCSDIPIPKGNLVHVESCDVILREDPDE